MQLYLANLGTRNTYAGRLRPFWKMSLCSEHVLWTRGSQCI